MPLNYSSSKKKKSTTGSTSSKSSVKNSGLTNLGRMIAENDPQAIWSVQRRTERQDRLDDVQRRFNEYLARDAWNNRLATLDGPIAGPREEKAYWQSKLKSSENSMRSAQSRMGYNDNAVFDPTAKRDYESAKRSRDLAKRNYTTLAAQDELLNSGAYDKQAQKNKFIQGAKDMSYENLLATINSGYLTNEQRQWGEDILREKANSTQAKSRSDYYNAEADKLEAELAERYATGYDGTPEGGYLYGQSLKMVDNLRNMAKQYSERGWMAERLELGENAKNSPTYEQDYMMVPNRAYNREYQALFGLVSDDDLSTKDEISAARRREVMTDEEKYNYSAIYNTQGAEKAHDYLDALGYELDQRLQTQKTEAVNARLDTIRNAENAIPDTGIKWLDDYIEKSAKQNMEAGWFLEARANNVASGMGALDALWQGVTSGGVRPVNWNTESFTPHTVSQAIQENQLNQIDSSVGRFAYQTAGSMVDSLVVMGATVLGVPGATAILGGAAATDSMLKAKERGATDSQALSVGLLSGVAEALFEQVSLEKLLTAGTPATLKEVIKNMLFRQGVTEASEEVFTTIANTISDAILMGDKSELRTKIRQYVEQGYSQSDAEKLGAIDWFKDLGMDALGGFVSGAIFGGFEQGASYGGFRSDMSNLQNSQTAGAAVDNYSAAMQRVLDENGEVRKDSENAAKKLQETYQQTMEGLSDRSTRYEEISHVIDQQVEQGQMTPEDAQVTKAFVEFTMGEQAYNQKTQEQRAKQATELDQKARGMVQNMAEKSTATISSTQSIVDNYDSSIANPSEYFGAFRYYEEMGQQARATGNDNFAEVWKNDERYAGKISQQAAMTAFAAGRTTAAPASKIMQVTERGTGTLTYSDEAMRQLSNNVKSVNDAVELLSAFAKKTGFTVNLDESLADGENAKFIANAMTIAINPRANVIAGLFHESGHAVQRFNPQAYSQLKADMISWYAQTQGMTNMDQMLKQYGKAYKGYSRDALEVEMTNDAFGALFNREDSARDIAKWLTENKTEAEQKSFIDKLNALIDRIINWVKGLVNYEGVSPMQKKTIDMQVEKAQAFRKAFLDALDKAAESARMATEYRVDVDATQYDSVAASKSMIDFSLNIATLNYAETYTADSDDAKEKLSTLGDTLETLWAIEQEIKKGEGKTSHSIHDINKYLESHPDIHQRLLDVQKAANDAGITCDFVTPIGEEVKVEGKKVAPGLKGLPIEYVEAAEGSSKYVERTSDEYRHEGYKFTAFKRTIPQMFLDSVPPNVRETVRTELVKAVEDAYEKGKGSTILTDIDKAFPSIKEIKAVAGPFTRGNIYNKTMPGVQAPLRSAEKTVMALNLNSACPMFTIGNHGCYLDACYLTQMANGATGTNLFRTAWYTGELLQLNDEAIATMNALGGLRINGVGDTTMDNVSQLLDVLKHAQMRGLNVKIITKQATTFDMLSQAKKAGITLPNITVQPSMDNLWIPATLDDVYGAGVRGKTQLADTVKKGNLDAAAEAYDKFFGRATKEVDGVLYRKYGFSPEQVQQMMERAQKEFPEVTVTPRYVVCTPEEIAEIALNKNKFVVNGGAIIQTLMHGKVPEGCISDYGTTIVNFGGLRHVIERKNGVWDFYGVTVKEGKDANGNKTTIIKRASGKNSPYQAVLDYVNGTVDGKPRFTDMEKAKIWFTLKETMCCQANESKDACAGCSSLCANGATLMNVKARQSDTLQTVEEGDVLPNWVEKTEEITTDFSRTVDDREYKYLSKEENERIEQIREEKANYIKAVDEWYQQYKGNLSLARKRTNNQRIFIGDTGEVYQALGSRENSIHINTWKISEIIDPKARDSHFDMGLDEIKAIPDVLSNPAIILVSKNADGSPQNNRMVVFGTPKSSISGMPINVVLDVRPQERKMVVSGMQLVTSAYTKSRDARASREANARRVLNFIQSSDVLYINKKLTTSLLKDLGFQSPAYLQLRSGYVGSITYNYADVKGNGEKVVMNGVPFGNLWTQPNDIDSSRAPTSSLSDTERRTLEKRVREAERNAAKEKQRAEHFKSEMRLTPKFTPDATQISELATEISTMFGGADVDTASIEKSLRDIFWNINEANSSGKEARAYAALDLAQQVAETVVNASVSGDMTTTLEGKMMKNEVVAMGANAIMDRILQTRMAKSTAADKWNSKLQETRKALGQTETYAAKEAKRADRLESELTAYKQKMADQISFLKAKADADHAFNRQAYEQRIARVRAQRDIALREQKEYYKGRIGELSEQKRVAKIMPKVKKEVDALRKMLLSPDEKTYKYVPDIVRGAVSDFLSCVDFVTRTMAETGVELKSDAREVTKLDAIRKLAEQAKDMQNSDVDADYFLDLPSDTVEVIDLLRDRVTSLVGVLQEAQSAGLIDSEIHVRTADSTTLEIIRKLARTINHAVTNINKNYVQGRFAHVDDGARATVQFLEGVKRSEHYHRSLGNSLLWSMSTPYYAFRRFGDGGQAVFENLGAGLAQFAKNIKTILNFVDETFTRAEQREWANQTVTVNATNAQGEEQTLTMTATQLMSLYCLARREAAQNHLYTGGITLQETKAGKTTISQEQAVHLTPESLFSAFDQLSDRQKEVAQKLQEFMSTVGSDWGNEVSMKRWGVNAFEEQFYFPMKTSDNGRATLKANDDDASSLYGMVNQGFTKHLQTNANNALVIDDVFSVFTDHSANMAKYNAMVLPLLDAMKWYNWTQRADTATAGGDFHRNDISVKGAIKEAFGTGATQYFRQFIADLNSAKQEGGAGFDIGSRLMSHYKAASVGANLRVALLQPTAFFRAGMLLSPTDLARGAAMRGGQEEMLKHSGIAQWKDLGFYDTDVGRSVRRQIQGERTKVAEARNKIVDVSMKAAEWGDKITWAALWNACKIEQQRQNKGVSYEELMRLTEKRFNEVVFATQVFDSTLSRSEVMRKRDPYHKIITAFMSEPTLSYNMVLDKFMQYSIDAQKLGKGKAWAKHGGMITKSLAVYTVTNLVAALAESIMDAYRDDDDEPWLEKFMEKFFGDWSEVDDIGSAMKALYSGNFMADMTVIGKIPLAKDVISLLQGYDIGGRMDTMAIQNIANLVKIWDEKYSLYTGKLDKPTAATWYGNMTMYGAIYKSLQALSQFIGVPLYNFMRDITPVYNDTIGSLTGFKLDTYQSTQERTRNTMKEQYGMTPEEEEFAKENDLTKPFMEKYYTKEYENLGTTPKKAGIPLDVFTDYSNRVADAGATKKEEIMQIIDSMSIDNAMKDKLYLIKYKESKISEAPWH